MENVNPPPNTRHNVPENPLGLTGMDHVALPVTDPAEAARFYTDVLGGELYYSTGFTDEEQRQGQVPHLFIHIGTTMVQLAPPTDRKTFPDPENESYWPHWAFGCSAETLDRMGERLRDEGIPFSGPRSHENVEAVSLYFMDTEGNKLEICTWDPYPQEKADLLTAATAFDWPSLAHSWSPREEKASIPGG